MTDPEQIDQALSTLKRWSTSPKAAVERCIKLVNPIST
jgi:hypothetical protein